MAPAAASFEEASYGGGGGGAAKEEEDGCSGAWSAWWSHVRCLLGLPCHATLGRLCPAASACASPGTAAATVSGTLFLPSTGCDRRVRLFLQEHEAPFLVLDLPVGLGATDIAAAGRIVLEHRREWETCGGAAAAGSADLLESPRWVAYCNGRRVQGFAVRREQPSDAEGWVMEKLRAVTAGAGRLPSGGAVDYLRGRFERITGSPDAQSFHLVEPAGWREANGGGGSLSIFFHRI